MKTEYMIKISPCYSAGTCNAPQQHYLTIGEIENNHDDGIAFFDDEESAQKVINKLESGNYYLGHGEMGRPSYEIVSAEEENDKSDCYDAAKLGDLGAWKQIDKSEVPADILQKLENSAVEYDYDYDGDSDIYSATEYAEDAEGDEVAYMIAYCVKTAAIQRNSDDLGGVNWEKPGFYKG